MKNGMITILDQFINLTAMYCKSIMLVGSQASGLTNEESDLDLIVIAHGHNEAMEVRKIASRFGTNMGRAILDCKVYTEDEFTRARSGSENRFIWTCMKQGKVVYGMDIIDTVQLKPDQTRDSYWEHIQNVENAILDLDNGIHFTGSCYHLYDALATTYFIEAFIFQSAIRKQRKEEFIASVLEKEYSIIRDRFYWVFKHISADGLKNNIRVPSSMDQRFSRTHYDSVHKKAIPTLDYARNTYRRLAEWADNLANIYEKS
ncbi:MAG: hypothetical protein EAX81_07620 [Candidatus Thorarchaeota archaeon]|nr:hypothetical protein [Candidatus Thorarchaeota archaeon]